MENEERTFEATYLWKGTIEVEARNAEHAEKIVWDLVVANGLGSFCGPDEEEVEILDPDE
tara:strand:+ start:398 stop:577 length:180 start_codon:yes stop_codon:yes gene_type:complete